jgi:anti-sigma B factor antagonist
MAQTTSPELRGHPRRTALTSQLGDCPDLRTSWVYDGIDRITVRVDGEIDVATVDELRDALDIAIAKGVRQVIVDLRGVSSLGTDGVNCLAEASQSAKTTGCRLYTIATERAVVRTVDITGFARALRVLDDPATVPSPYLDC